MFAQLFPNGIGTRGVIAFLVVGGYVAVCVMQRDISALKEVALIALVYYFADRTAAARAARNGGP